MDYVRDCVDPIKNILTDNEQNLYQILKKPSYITTSSLKNSWA